MQVFKDRHDRSWSVEITIKRCLPVSARTGVSIYGLVADGCQKLIDLAQDPETVARVLWVLVEDQAKDRGIDEDSFYDGLAGDPLMAAMEALFSEVSVFFPGEQVRRVVAKLLEKMRGVRDAMWAEMEQKLDAIEVDYEASRLLGSSTRPPESSASTLAPSPSTT